jgi:predicted regulator of Ras-like GTPase activity (Roadblock/LC7/MglB family)
MPREYREERLVRVLREQLHENVAGMQEAVIVTNDGLVVAAYPGIGEEQDAHVEVGGSHWIAALAAEIIAQSRRAFGQLAQGAVSRILVEGESGSMIVVPAGDYAALAVMVDTHTKLGLAMFQIAHVAEHIGGLLQSPSV